jgi:hypothetical protein
VLGGEIGKGRDGVYQLAMVNGIIRAEVREYHFNRVGAKRIMFSKGLIPFMIEFNCQKEVGRRNICVQQELWTEQIVQATSH